jgi:hypothetical protein
MNSRHQLSTRFTAIGLGTLLTASLLGAAPVPSDDTLGDRIESILLGLPDRAVFDDTAGQAGAVPLDPRAGLNIAAADGRRLSVELGNPSSGRAASLRGGAVAHDNGDGSVSVPIPKEDGSLQIVTVVENAAAPTEYTYGLDLPKGTTIEETDDGALGFVAADGSFLGGIAAPWAVDAEGTEVPTRYVVSGTDIVQVVDHASGDYVYPIVADPWLGIDLYYSPSVTFPSGGYKINVTPTAWGAAYSGVGNVGMWWAHRDEVRSKLGSQSWRWTTTIQEQFYCHIAGYPLGLPQYNMESWRPLVYWETSLVAYQCNP